MSESRIVWPIFILLALIALVFISLPHLKDFLRMRAYDTLIEAKARDPSIFDDGLHDAEDLFVSDLAAHGLRPLSIQAQGTSEIYRVLIARTLGDKSGVITLHLRPSAHWSYQPSSADGLLPAQTGILTDRAAASLSDFVRRCHFWKLADYGSIYGTDGETWYFEGYSNGRYRRLEEFSPESGIVHDLCHFAADLIDCDLVDSDK